MKIFYRFFISLFFSFFFYSSWSSSFSPLNPYEVLGVSKEATINEIKKQRNHLLFMWHSDRWSNLSDTETKDRYRELTKDQRELSIEDINSRVKKKIVEINWAWDLLSDSNKRKEYDKSGTVENIDTDFFRDIFKGIFSEKDFSSEKDVVIKSSEKKALELLYELSFFQESPESFIEKRKRYEELLRKAKGISENLPLIGNQRDDRFFSRGIKRSFLTSKEKEELHKYRLENLNDVNILKKILQRLGLSPESLHPILLESFLKGFGDELSRFILQSEFYKNKNAQTLKSFISKQESIRILNYIKEIFDTNYYEALRNNSNPLTLNFVKNFPAQYLIFNMALGASIYLHAVADKKFSGYEKNPGELKDVIQHSLTFPGVMSFAVFMAVSQQVNYRIYGLGRFIDGKTIFGKPLNGKTARSLAPAFGIGLGFFASAVFGELLMDPISEDCIKEFFTEVPENIHISACEEFYLKWEAEEKWKSYAVDIVGIMGSSVIAHKISSALLNRLDRTMVGHRAKKALSAKKIGLHAMRFGNFFLTLFLFLEVHKVIDEWLANPVKKQLTASGVKGASLSFWWESQRKMKTDANLAFRDDNDIFERVKLSIRHSSHKFKSWINELSKKYQISYYYWSMNLNRKLIDYEGSLDVLAQFFSEEENANSFTRYFNKEVFVEELAVYRENKFSMLTKYCSNLKDIKNQDMKIWRGLCHKTIKEYYFEEINLLFFSDETTGDHYDEDEFVNETISFIYQNLKNTIEENSFQIKAEDYLSLEPTELFSLESEFHLDDFLCSESNTDIVNNKFFTLAMQMLQKGLEDLEDLEGLEGEYNKYLTAGIYLLKRFKHPLIKAYEDKVPCFSLKFDEMEALISLFSIHKTGEKYFLDFLEERSQNQSFSIFPEIFPEKSKNPYFIFYDLICGSQEDSKKEVFSIPQLSAKFNNISIYNVQKNEFEELAVICADEMSEKDIHKFIFDTRTRYINENYSNEDYSNLYILLRKIIRNSYEDLNGLMESYYNLSKDQMETLSKGVIDELKLLVDKFYRQFINFEGIETEDSEELLSYYDKSNIEFNWTCLTEEVTGGFSNSILGDCKQNFKALETSIFHVNFLLKFLKEILIKGEEIHCSQGQEDCLSLNGKFLNLINSDLTGKGNIVKWAENFSRIGGLINNDNIISFDQKHLDVISSLHTIHECYKKNTGGCLIIDDSSTTVFLNFMEYFSDKTTRDDTWLSEVIDYYIETKTNPTNSPWEDLIYSVLFEIKKSLDLFFNQTSLLEMKNHFEKRTQFN
ncbi:MAG: hypothetical protein GDA46_05465 [Bdellovibrionales bacterium]|nr:hypothetical protein [Bdellovibrionales bacterium]